MDIILEKYWLEKLKEETSLISLYGVKPKNHRASKLRYVMEIPDLVIDKIEKATNGSDIGRVCYFLCAYFILLRRYSSENNFVIAIPEINSDRSNNEGNIIFIKTNVMGNDSVKDLLKKCKQTILEAYQHQAYDHKELIDKLERTHAVSAESLLQFGFVDTSIQSVNQAICKSGFLLTYNKVDQISTFEYDPKITSDFVGKFGRHYLKILHEISHRPTSYIREIEILDNGEKQLLLKTLNKTQRTIEDISISALFERNAAFMQDATAVIFQNVHLSYRQLSTASNKLAQTLLSKYKLNKGDIVSVGIESSFDFIISILSVLKTGAAVLPIVGTDPEERNAYILKDSSAKLLITYSTSPLTCHLEIDQFHIDKHSHSTDFVAELPQVNNEDLAYVIYTSGSTGMPKGVCITHANIHNMLQWFVNYFSFTDDDVFPQKTTVSFVDSLVEIFLPITLGRSTLYLRPFDDIIKSPKELYDWLSEIKTSIVQFVPSVFDVMTSVTDLAKLPSLRSLILSGEVVKRTYSFDKQLYNLYGCSEGTAASTIYQITTTSKSPSTIGVPIDNTQVYVLDENYQLVPIGVEGRLFIGGKGIAQGYLHQSTLTQEKFIDNPFNPDERLYCTGDIVKWNEALEIEYLGRNDSQLKIRGMRVEAGEIERVILLHEHINEVIVTVYAGPKEDLLVAYMIIDDSFVIDELRYFLSAHISEYMIPTHFVKLNQIPRTSSGKIKINELPDPIKNQMTFKSVYIAPQTAIEKKLVLIWKEVLAIEQPIGVEDNFIDLGGHSINAIKILSRIERDMKSKVSLKEFFLNPKITKLAHIISKTEQSPFVGIDPAPIQDFYIISNAQKRLWILYQFEPNNIAYNLSHTYFFNGGLNVKALERAFGTLLERHESLRTIFTVIDGEPMQKILPIQASIFKLEIANLTSNNVDKDEVAKIVDKEVKLPFDLANGPLIRAKLFQYAENKYAFSCTLHHIITDGWSMKILINDVLTLYNAYSNKLDNPLKKLKIQYRDYCVWQNNLLASDSTNVHKEYWVNQLSGNIVPINLPIDYPRTKLRKYEGAMARFGLDKNVTQGLKTLNNRYDVTMFSTLLTIVKILLYKYSGQEDIVIGSPVAGRSYEELESQIGLYLNNLVLRDQVNDEMTFPDLLSNVQNTILEAFDHQIYPYDVIINNLCIEAEAGRNPLYDVMVVMAVEGVTNQQNDQLKEFVQVEGLNVEHVISKLDLSFFFLEEERLSIGIEYRIDLFKPETISKMISDFKNLTYSIIQDSEQKIYDLKRNLMVGKQINEHNRFNNTMMEKLEEEF